MALWKKTALDLQGATYVPMHAVCHLCVRIFPQMHGKGEGKKRRREYQ